MERAKGKKARFEKAWFLKKWELTTLGRFVGLRADNGLFFPLVMSKNEFEIFFFRPN